MFLKSGVSLKQEIKYNRIMDFIKILYTVDRYEAARIAIDSGQCTEPLIMGNRLDSSDIF